MDQLIYIRCHPMAQPVQAAMSVDDDEGFLLTCCEEVTIRPLSHAVVRIGIKVHLPSGYYGFLRMEGAWLERLGLPPQSYEWYFFPEMGEIKVPLVNYSRHVVTVTVGDRLVRLGLRHNTLAANAQEVVLPRPEPWVCGSVLQEREREWWKYAVATKECWDLGERQAAAQEGRESYGPPEGSLF